MAINLNRTQPRSGKKLCRSTSERRADWAEQLISKIDNSRPYCDSFGNAMQYSAASCAQEQAEEPQDYSLEAVMQVREEHHFAPPAQSLEQAAQDTYPTDASEVEEAESADASLEQCQPQTFKYAERDNADGVMRTTEFLRQPSGTFIRPHYNRSGILTAIDFSDGCRFFRADAKSPWLVLDQCSKAVDGIDITSVSIDPRGNVVYIVGGEKSVIHIDGVMQ